MRRAFRSLRFDPALHQPSLEVAANDAGRSLVPDHARIGRHHILATDDQLHQEYVRLRGRVRPEYNDRIMHASLRIAGSEIMMSDGMKSGPLDFQCMSLSLSVPTEADADRLFNALAKDGTVQMPLGKAFFSPRFGAVADKFGVSWMIIVPPKH